MHAEHTKDRGGGGRVCVCMHGAGEQRDPFCQSGQCWKGFKAPCTVDILSRPLPCFIALTLFNMLSRHEKLLPCLCASKCACV